MPDALSMALHELGVPFQQNVPMAAHTSLRVGGPARFFVEAHDENSIARALRAAKVAGAPIYSIGNGSNLLVRDGGINGFVLRVASDMAAIEVNGTRIRAQGGARLSQVALAAQGAGLAGLEALSGIPGTIGGALAMNAGAYGTEIGSLVESVRVIDPEGQAHRLPASSMAFGYRTSALHQNHWIATEVILSLAQGNATEIQARMRDHAAQRRAKQPLTLPSAGSFFKRPTVGFAGAYIEQAGLKGMTVGGAQVSQKHAGFLVNTGNATAGDFLTLMAIIQNKVHEQFGILLEAEVQILGCDSYF